MEEQTGYLTDKDHPAEPDDDSRHCVVCRKSITRLSFTSWVHE